METDEDTIRHTPCIVSMPRTTPNLLSKLAIDQLGWNWFYRITANQKQ